MSVARKPELAKVLAQVEAAGYDPTETLRILFVENDPEEFYTALLRVLWFYQDHAFSPNREAARLTYEAACAFEPIVFTQHDTLTIADGDPDGDLPI